MTSPTDTQPVAWATPSDLLRRVGDPSTAALWVNKYALTVNELEQSGPLSPRVCGEPIMDSLEP